RDDEYEIDPQHGADTLPVAVGHDGLLINARDSNNPTARSPGQTICSIGNHRGCELGTFTQG
ncbi:MAG TPA: hypothetical protein PLV41_10590, partial [Miltoncostaeales bacterium]|nr:hypothetical protein [Miltoncostaeales bacterium]